MQLLRKISLILFLVIFAFMFFHMAIVIVGTALTWWHVGSTPHSVALTTFLYYVLPLIFLLFIYFLTSQLLQPTQEISEELSTHEATPIKKSSKKSSSNARTVPNKKTFSRNRSLSNKKSSYNDRTVSTKKPSYNDKTVPNQKSKERKG